ncbi:MAG: glycosyltransferase [Pyrinomonadaceae bacterium]
MKITEYPPQAALRASSVRPRAQGKFIFVGDEKLYLRGVTYGTFRPDERGGQFPPPAVVEKDFALMSGHGINTIRTYTVPPVWFLDLALRHDLRVMVGLPWEQHIAFLDDTRRAREIVGRVRAAVRSCEQHPAILCYTIGNEIPAPVVRWHGKRRVERFLHRLFRAVKGEDSEALVTYVNYPSTEYLELPFVDFFCFNVYLESQERLAAYLARLQNLAGDRPLVMAEIGLDSRRNGEQAQAETLKWQIETAFAAGCAGAFLFAWTDEWWRGGFDIEDWDFGLVRRDRTPKPALLAVAQAFKEIPFPATTEFPSVSVVVCSYNGALAIRDCLEGLLKLKYTNYEVIIVDDGSTDETAAIAGEYPFRVISTKNQGLSAARNVGMEAARGEIVAYTDDDARPDEHWLQYLAHAFMTSTHAGIGGPNIAPAGDGLIADAIANAPGGPVHVLLSDTEAEHIPGCNMAFRREALLEVEGCDAIFRAAGDDVDLCWRVQASGHTIGFSHAAMVWHHRRNSVRTYWKQQQGYGKAEALLEGKWPEKYNAAGHLAWTGRLYGKGLTQALVGWSRRSRIYQGTWGSNLFQSIYQPAAGLLTSLPLMPEWYLIIASLAALSFLGLMWTPLLAALPLLLLAVGALLAQAGVSAAKAHFTSLPQTRAAWFKLWSLTALLHLMQPLARLKGRLRFGLTPWRMRGVSGLALLRSQILNLWSEQWHAAEERLLTVEKSLRERGACVMRGGDFDRWDLEVRGGLLGCARTLMMVEEHGGGKQLARFRVWPKCSPKGSIIILALYGLALSAAFNSTAFDGACIAAACLGAAASFLVVRAYHECAAAIETLLRNLQSEWEERTGEAPMGVPETLVAEPPPAAQKAAAASAGARGGGHVRISSSPTISSAEPSLFRNHAETKSGLGELRYHNSPEED